MNPSPIYPKNAAATNIAYSDKEGFKSTIELLSISQMYVNHLILPISCLMLYIYIGFAVWVWYRTVNRGAVL